MFVTEEQLKVVKEKMEENLINLSTCPEDIIKDYLRKLNIKPRTIPV